MEVMDSISSAQPISEDARSMRACIGSRGNSASCMPGIVMDEKRNNELNKKGLMVTFLLISEGSGWGGHRDTIFIYFFFFKKKKNLGK